MPHIWLLQPNRYWACNHNESIVCLFRVCNRFLLRRFHFQPIDRIYCNACYWHAGASLSERGEQRRNVELLRVTNAWKKRCKECRDRAQIRWKAKLSSVQFNSNGILFSFFCSKAVNNVTPELFSKYVINVLQFVIRYQFRLMLLNGPCSKYERQTLVVIPHSNNIHTAFVNSIEPCVVSSFYTQTNSHKLLSFVTSYGFLLIWRLPMNVTAPANEFEYGLIL